MINVLSDLSKTVFVSFVLAIIFMAFFATIIMKILTKYKWVSWLGLIFLLYLSTEMVIDGFPGFYEIFRK